MSNIAAQAARTQAGSGNFDPPRGPALGAAGNPFRFETQRVIVLEAACYAEARARFDQVEAAIDALLDRMGLPKVRP